MAEDPLWHPACCCFNCVTCGPLVSSAANDAKDLTDGRFAQTEMMWIDEACVGWSGGPQSITIELGQIEPIGGVGYRAGG